MDEKLKKSLAKAIKKAIMEVLETNKGIEKELDWFSIKCQNI